MRINIDHARALATELLGFHFSPIDGDGAGQDPAPGADGGTEFHLNMRKALLTYADNTEALTRTAHAIGDSALHTLAVVEAVDEEVATELTRQVGTLT